VEINFNQAAFVPQDFAARDFPAQGFAAQGFAAQNLATQRTAAAGFTTEDVLWALGIWSVILTLSPVIVFYMLMVA
jgi:hypothetical protein